MAEVTVKQLAQVVGTPIDKLLVQLSDAGIAKAGESDVISDSEKLTLLTHLRESRGQAGTAGPAKKITLKRKRVSELKTDPSGRRKVNVEVRSKRTYVRPGDEAVESGSPAAELPPVEGVDAPVVVPIVEPIVQAPVAPTEASIEAAADAAEQVAAQVSRQASAAAEAAVAAQVAAAAAAAEAPVVTATVKLDPAAEAERQAEAQAAAAAALTAQVEKAAMAATVATAPTAV
ncbi:MAG: translation initiation factor IF-2, partial [Pseudomonadales bacterium]